MAPRMSPGVTMPSKCPYSSNTSAMCTTELRMAVSTEIASARSSTTGAGFTSARMSSGAPEAKMSIRSLRTEHADDLVGLALMHRQHRAVRRAQHLHDLFDADRLRSIVSTSRRGVIRPRADAIGEAHDAGDHRLLFGLEHALALGLGDDGLDLFVGHPLVARAASGRAGAAAAGPRHRARTPAARRRSASTFIAGATRAAMPSASRSAICLGTSSPTISEM